MPSCISVYLVEAPKQYNFGKFFLAYPGKSMHYIKHWTLTHSAGGGERNFFTARVTLQIVAKLCLNIFSKQYAIENSYYFHNMY